MPGTDVAEAVRVVFGELDALPYLPELPARGIGADLIGRTAALLVDLPTEVVPSGYRVADRPGKDTRRGLDLMERDLDTVYELAGKPRAVKVQLAGPWTLTAGIELARGQRILTDRGALRDFAESLTEGLRWHVAEVQRRTGSPVLVQLDEPTLPHVLAGGLRTPSGHGHLAAVPEPEVRELLAPVIDAARAATGAPVIVHCCADLRGGLALPVTTLRKAGADALAFDATGFADASAGVSDQLGEAIEDGMALVLGLVPSTAGGDTLRELATPALELTDRLGFARKLLGEQVMVTPTCGLAGAHPDDVRPILRRCTELAEAFVEPPESWE